MNEDTGVALPTHEEIDQACDMIAARGPVPLAQFVDSHPILRQVVTSLDQWPGTRRGLYVLLKTAFVSGLHVGLVIGELRARRK